MQYRYNDALILENEIQYLIIRVAERRIVQLSFRKEEEILLPSNCPKIKIELIMRVFREGIEN